MNKNKLLYVDNYRGFTDTTISLRDVNFFVGENSTGKSSILALIALISYPQFWFFQDFNCSGVHLGTFRDIVSVGNPERKDFKIGFLGWRKKQAGRGYYVKAFMLTFVERDGLPIVSELSYVGPEHVTRCKIGKRTLSYTRRKLSSDEITPAKVQSIFKQWIKSSPRKYEKRVESNDLGRTTLMNIDFLIKQNEKSVPEFDPFAGNLSPYGAVVWIAPIRTKPKRTYDEFSLEFSSEGVHTPYLFRSLKQDRRRSKAFNSFLHDVGRNSGLFTTLQLGTYGKSPTAPFSLNVVLGSSPLPLSFVGYGVSQSLPVIVELFYRSEGTSFAIQQPEVHLHPRAQAALGDVIFDMAYLDHKTFFIETHSDYTLDRFRLRVRQTENAPATQILYFTRSESGNNVISIPVLENGEFSADQPESFREFFLHEELSLLGLR